MGVVKRRELGLARLPGITGIGGRQRDDIGNALLVAIAVERIHQRLRRRRSSRQRLQQIIAWDVASHHCDKLVLVEAVLGKHGIEKSAVETTVGRPKSWVVGDSAADDFVGDVEPQSRGLLVGNATVDQRFEDRVDDPHLFGLLNIDRGTKLLS